MPAQPANFMDHFVAVALGHIEREYPNKLDHVMNDAKEVLPPRTMHPIFYGSFDWHSSVHGHWLLVRALRLTPQLGQRTAVTELLDRQFTPEKVAEEVKYLGQKTRGTFERTYGWAWLLKLAAELRTAAAEVPPTDDRSAPFPRWDKNLRPLSDAFVNLTLNYLPKATYPIRVGTHNNSAFALALALDYAKVAKDSKLSDMISEKALAWYSKDENCPAWEPDGTDFLSPALVEVECIRRVLPPERFVLWLDKFLPGLAKGLPQTLFTPAIVTDRTDGQLAHLDGLNLSRAWCWRTLGRALPEGDPRRALAQQAYDTHLQAALPHVTGDYMGEHWLATFALLALTE